MRMHIVAARDVRIDAYMQPSFVAHTGAAVRAFTDHCRDSSTDFAKHPEDYELWYLGVFDDSDGSFSHPPDATGPVRLMRAVDAIIVKF